MFIIRKPLKMRIYLCGFCKANFKPIPERALYDFNQIIENSFLFHFSVLSMLGKTQSRIYPHASGLHLNLSDFGRICAKKHPTCTIL